MGDLPRRLNRPPTIDVSNSANQVSSLRLYGQQPAWKSARDPQLQGHHEQEIGLDP